MIGPTGFRPSVQSIHLSRDESMIMILKTAVEREKAVQAIDVQREWTHCVVTFWVMSQCVYFLV